MNQSITAYNRDIKTVANITYNGLTYNTPLFIEYKHTGERYFNGKKCYTTDRDIADRWIKEGIKIITKSGYYYISRIAIPTINAKGLPDKWYITNEGDSYTINKVSKYRRKIHAELSTEIKSLGI